MHKSYDTNEEMDYQEDVSCSVFSNDSVMKVIEIVEVNLDSVESELVETVHPMDKSDLELSSKYLTEENISTSEAGDETGDDFDVESEDVYDMLPFEDDVTASVQRKRRRQLGSLNLKRMCHVCGKIFKYPESLRRHLKTVHSDERPFKCHLCASSFNRNHNLTIHIKVVHQRERMYVKKNIPRLCDYCGKVLLSVRSLEEHISSIHTKNALYECDRCHSTFFRKMTLVKHKTSDECDGLNPKNCQSGRVFLKYCEFCGLEFKKEHFYIKHKFKHMSTFSCSICSLKFDNGTSLKEHIDSVHPELKPFECEVCHKKFKSKSLLNCHLVIHSGEKRYQCDSCPLKFLKKKYLSTHILTHTGERPFVCSICLKGFKQSGDMRKHKATHMRGRRLV